MRRYELMLLLRPDLEDDKLQAAVEKVTRAIVNAGGSLSKVSPWGKRRLAYEIERNREASYFLIHFDIEPAQIREIERGMLISEEILRHLVTVLEERGPAEEVPAAVAQRAADGEDGPSEAPPGDPDHAGGAAESAPAADTASVVAVESTPAGEPEGADRADEANDDTSNDDTSNDTSDEESNEERAEG